MLSGEVMSNVTTIAKWAVGTVAFFSSIGLRTFPLMAFYNLVPVVCFGMYWFGQIDASQQSPGSTY